MQSKANVKQSNQGLYAAVNQNVEDIVKQRNQKSICKAYAEQRKCKAEQRRAIKVC